MQPKCPRVQMSVSHRGAVVTACCFAKQVLAAYFCAKTLLKTSLCEIDVWRLNPLYWNVPCWGHQL